MKLVVDTNVLITFFWKNSFLRRVSLNQDHKFISPEWALVEINDNSEHIRKRAELSDREFLQSRTDLALFVEFVPEEEYADFLSLDRAGLSERDFTEIWDDIDFLALASKAVCPLWSNDARLKKQEKVRVLTTREVFPLLT